MNKRPFNKNWIFVVVAILAIFSFRYFSNSDGKSKKNSKTAKVEVGEILLRSTISGTVTPLRKTIVTAPYEGYVREVFVKLGQLVKKGDPIASVAQTLVSGDTVFPMRAPFSGKVVQINKSSGEYVKASDATDFIARIDDLSKMYVNSNVPELDRVKMKLGLQATVKASAILDRTYAATVEELSFAAREQDRYGRSTAVEFPMRLEVTDFDEQLSPGMSVIVDIVTLKKENILRLRHEFIGRNKDEYFVTLKGGKKQIVKLGVQNEEHSEILEGLKAGTEVQKVDFSESPELE